MTAVTHLLTDTITRAVIDSRDAAGDPIFGLKTTFDARHEEGSFLVQDDAGNEIQAKDKLIADQTGIDAVDRIALTDRIWLPDDDTSDDNKSRKIITIKSATRPDESLSLTEIFL